MSKGKGASNLWNVHDFIASGTLIFSREWWRVAAMNRLAATMAVNIGILPQGIIRLSLFSLSKTIDTAVPLKLEGEWDGRSGIITFPKATHS